MSKCLLPSECLCQSWDFVISSPPELKLFSFVFPNKCGSPSRGEPLDYSCNLNRLMLLCECVWVCVSSIRISTWENAFRDKAGCCLGGAFGLPQTALEYSMKPMLNHGVDGSKLIWELADKRKSWFSFSCSRFLCHLAGRPLILRCRVTVTRYRHVERKHMFKMMPFFLSKGFRRVEWVLFHILNEAQISGKKKRNEAKMG